METTAKNLLAYRLNSQLLDATEQFFRQAGILFDNEIAIGAANVFLTSLLATLPDKQLALDTLKACHQVQRNLIDGTPHAYFGNTVQNNPNLN